MEGGCSLTDRYPPPASKAWVRLIYGTEKGEAKVEVRDRVRDQEGEWMGVLVRGTNIPSLRQWQLMHPQTSLYLGLTEVREADRVKEVGVGQLLAWKEASELCQADWGENCLTSPSNGNERDENEQLRRQAAHFGLGLPAQDDKGEGEDHVDLTDQKTKKKKKSPKQRVKEMLNRAKWSCTLTPLDPKYRKPLKIRLKRKKASSSTSASSSGSLATGGQEAPRVMVRKGGSKPLLREAATLSLALDLVVRGRILQMADLLAQRLKSLELIQGGTPGELASQMELLPKEVQGLSTQAETRLAKDDFYQEHKLQQQLKGKGPGKKGSYTPATGKDGKGVGKTGDKRNPKGRKGEETYLDNFDELSVASKELLESEAPSLAERLRLKYEELRIPRNTKKAVSAAPAAEIQGAWLDGSTGICRPKSDKVAKYLASLNFVMSRRKVSQKQMQMLVGGLVYLFSFRRPLMAILGQVWQFIVSFDNDKAYLPIPREVREELFAAFFLSSLAFMDFRLETDHAVTASDASESGGGLCATIGLTSAGQNAAAGQLRGETVDPFETSGLLIISAFDGIGAIRVAADTLDVNVVGFISIEKDPQARRVVEAHYPSAIFIDDICSVSVETVQEWAALFPTCTAVLLTGGPPCQGTGAATLIGATLRAAAAWDRSFLGRQAAAAGL
eukprot:Skav235355  [mRNA]  locus=scaffold665:213254:217513:- [translate_table: standard]